jgi:ABC-type nitrate/sulfonate/bicarbonate transport system substrate-binding protein
MNWNRIDTRFAWVLAFVLACGLGALPAAAQTDKTTIRIANLDIGPFVSVAYVEKLAAKHGISVKITNFRRGLEAAQALKANEADVAVGGVEAAVTAIAGGAPAVIVSSCSTGGIAWVGRPDMNWNRIDTRFALVLAFVLACGLGARPAVAQTDKTTIRIANLDIGPFVSVAYVEKLAAKHGISVKITNFRRGLEAAQALKANEADVAVGGVEAAVTAIAGGSPAVIVSSCSTGGIAWVGRPDMNWKTPADLKGKKFGVIRGLHELVMRVVFELNGLTASTEPGADVQIVFINSPPAVNTAMRARDIDAMSNPEPFPSRAVVEGFAKPFMRPYDTPL